VPCFVSGLDCNDMQSEDRKRNNFRHIPATQVTPKGDRTVIERTLPGAEVSSDLGKLVAIWPKMPEHIRAAIVALTGTSNEVHSIVG
jgi:hypothetical protein